MRARFVCPVVLATLLAGGAVEGRAQTGSGEGFLFGAPRGALTLRAGFDQPQAGGAFLGQIGRELSLGRGDYGALNLGADLSFRVSPRVDLAFGVGFARSSADSEYRDWLEGDLPIAQRTRFTRVPVTATARYFLTPRGTSLSRFAWVPARVTPFVGAGAGLTYGNYTQTGDFIPGLASWTDGQPFPAIEAGERRTSGWTPTAHGLAGVEFALSPRLGLTTEARYTFGRADVRGVGFDATDARLDLSGLQATVGLSIRY